MNLRGALFFRLVIVNLPVDWSSPTDESVRLADLGFGYSCGTGSLSFILRP
jgi:hypothetical protein